MSFSAEMRDFLSAYQTGQKIVGAQDDREYNATKKKYLEAQTETINQKNNDEEGFQLDLEGKRARNRAQNASAIANEKWAANIGKVPPDPNAALYAGVQPMAPPQQATEAPAVPVTQVPAGVPGALPAFSRGGAVKKFADGGAVDNDGDESSTDDDADGDGVPATPAVGGTSTSTDISSRSRGTPGYSLAAGLDAVKAGANFGAAHNGIHRPAGINTSATQAGAHAWATGAHAAPALDMDRLRDAVDPGHTMSDSDRNMAAMGAVYQFKMKQGDTDGAARSAYQMLQYYRGASSRYAALAAVAAQKGDLDTATHAAMKAYANIPDGKNFQVVKTPDGKLSYTMTDMGTGKVTLQGVEPPDKLAAAAMDLGRGGFDQQLVAAINQTPYTPPPPPAAPKPMKVSDKTAIHKQVDAAYAAANPDTIPDPNDDTKTIPNPKKYSAEDQALHKGMASRLVANPNNDITPDEATQLSMRLHDSSIPAKGGFDPKQADGGVKVTYKNHTTFVPQDDWDASVAKRAEDKAVADKKAEDGAKASGETLKGAIDTVKGGWDAVKGWNAKENARAKADIAASDAAPKSAVPVDYYPQPQP